MIPPGTVDQLLKLTRWIGRDDHVAGVHKHSSKSGSLLRI
jgi:hypothetical protein